MPGKGETNPMTYIPKQVKQARDRVEAKLDRELIRQLELYCQYLESDRDYIISQALEIAFHKDKAFSEWVSEQALANGTPVPGDHAQPQEEKRRGRRRTQTLIQSAAPGNGGVSSASQVRVGGTD